MAGRYLEIGETFESWYKQRQTRTAWLVVFLRKNPVLAVKSFEFEVYKDKRTAQQPGWRCYHDEHVPDWAESDIVIIANTKANKFMITAGQDWHKLRFGDRPRVVFAGVPSDLDSDDGSEDYAGLDEDYDSHDDDDYAPDDDAASESFWRVTQEVAGGVSPGDGVPGVVEKTDLVIDVQV